MASDDSSGPRPAAPIVIRIKLRYDDVEVMVARFATNVGKSGLFLPTKALQPIGAEIKFELRLADDTTVLVGLGRVKAATAPDPNNPKATFGMAIELMRVTPQSRALILRMLERRRAVGLPELGLPTPADIDAARRAEVVNAAVRDLGSVPVPVPRAPSEAAPPPEPGKAAPPPEPGKAAPPPEPGEAAPPPQPGEAAPPPAPGEALLTAPRRQTGPMAAAKVLGVTPLAPEPPRRKRKAISEVLDSASGPIASVSAAGPGLEDDVDLAAAIVRARALAGGGLDAELEALSEVAAAPLEISIDAASAELARQFGGNAVLRDRSARWAPPLAVTFPAQPEASLPVAQGKLEQAPDEAPAQALDEAPAQAPEWRPDALPEPQLASSAGFAPPNIDPIAPEPAPRAPTPEHLEIEPDQIADEIHQLDELDLEDIEHTEMGEIPVGLGALDRPGDSNAVSAVDQALLATRPFARLAEAEAEADADDLGLAGAVGLPVHGDPAGAYDDRASLDAEPRDGGTAKPIDLSPEEFDDFEILAEADADDADLLTAHGEQEASASHVIHDRPPSIERRVSELDFAARLDLDAESDMYFSVSANEFATHHVHDAVHDEFADRHAHDGLHGSFEDEPRLPDPPLDSAGFALAAFETGDESIDETGDEPLDEIGDEPVDQIGDEPLDDGAEPGGFEPSHGVQPIFEPEPSSTYTIAGIPSDSADLDFSPSAGPEPAGASRPPISQPAVSHQEPAILHSSPPLVSLYDSPVEDYELENALEALDVNLDALSIPQAAPRLPHNRDSSGSRPTAVIRQAPQAQSPAAQGRVSVPTPSRAVRQTGSVAPGSGRVVAPPARPPTDDGVVIEFVDDDDDE